MVIDLEFMLTRFPALSLELGRLLDSRFVPGESAYETPIGHALGLMLQRQNEGDLLGRDTHFVRLQFLAKHLAEIEQHDAQMLGVYRRKLMDPNLGNFFGTRFEISMAASLIRTGVPFRRRSQGGLDFLFEGDFEGIGIECASSHLPDPLEGPHVLDKVWAAISRKSAKKYATPANVLALDVTNLQAIGIDHRQGVLVSSQYEVELGSLAAESGFGAVLWFWLQTKVKDGRVEGVWSRYARAINPEANRHLIEFLDQYYANWGHVDPPDWRVPYMP